MCERSFVIQPYLIVCVLGRLAGGRNYSLFKNGQTDLCHLGMHITLAYDLFTHKDPEYDLLPI